MDDSTADKILETARKEKQSAFYNLSSIMGYFNQQKNAEFAILLGGRQAGKTYAVLNHFTKENLKYGTPFYVFRLTEYAARKLLVNNAEKLLDPPIRRKYLTEKGWHLYTRGEQVYRARKDKDGKIITKTRVLFCTVKAFSTFYASKGEATFDHEFLTKNPKAHYNILIDEFQKEKDEKSQGDLCYQFVNSLENILRNTKERIRCFMCANTVDECSDILAGAFNFVPYKFGRFYLKNKRCVIDNIEPSVNYLIMREGSVAQMLMPDASTFTNRIKMDTSLITRQKLSKPGLIIKFTKDESDWFVLWDSRVIAPYKKQSIKKVIAMRPYLDEVYYKDLMENVVALFDTQVYRFVNLITLKNFERCMRGIKPRK